MTTKTTKLETALNNLGAAERAWERAYDNSKRVERALSVLAEGGKLNASQEDCLYDAARGVIGNAAFSLSLGALAPIAEQAVRQSAAFAGHALCEARKAVKQAEKAAARAALRREARQAA